MKHINKHIVCIASILLLVASCKPDDYFYKDLIKGKDIIYPGKIDSVSFRGGENRFLISTLLPTDPKVNRLILFWNGEKDSIVLSVNESLIGTKHSFLVDNVEENTYVFNLYSYNHHGDRSVGTQISGRVFGENYKSTLFNRTVSARSYNATTGIASITWLAETNPTFAVTKVRYTTTANSESSLILARSTNTASLPNYKIGSTISVQAGYLPVSTALDTLYSVVSNIVID